HGALVVGSQTIGRRDEWDRDEWRFRAEYRDQRDVATTSCVAVHQLTLAPSRCGLPNSFRTLLMPIVRVSICGPGSPTPLGTTLERYECADAPTPRADGSTRNVDVA